MGLIGRLGFLLLVGSLYVSCEEVAGGTFDAYDAADIATNAFAARNGYAAPAHGGYANHTYANTAYAGPSPWKTTPGTYNKEAFAGPLLYNGHGYSSKSVYATYLTSSSYNAYSTHCTKSYGQYPKISLNDLKNAFAWALYELLKYNKLDHPGYHAGNYSSYMAGHSGAGIDWFNGKALYFKEKEAMFMEYASLYLLKHHCLSKLDLNYILPNVKLAGKTGNPYGDSSCYAAYGEAGYKHKCRDSKYRTVDGSCNNLYHAYWGKASVCHLRLVPADYADGLSVPRVAHNGYELVNPRLVSTVALPDIPDRAYYTHLKMQFGQYLNHDITFTPVTAADYNNGVVIKCCPKSYHPQCYPIKIPVDDYYMGKYKRTCMNFVRSAPCPLCTLGPRNQMNAITSFIDQSALYGSSDTEVHRLRSHVYGLMRTGRDKYGHEILPPTLHPWSKQCQPKNKAWKCFDSGDVRVNQHPGMMHVHLVWLRRHNIHARNLYKVNPKWDDNRLFEEARRLTIAESQLITYREYLPIVFGPHLMEYFGLDVMHSGYTYYEKHTDPTTWNDYAAAACRFGHSQISGWFSLIGYHGVNNHTYGTYKNNSLNGFHLRDWFFDPSIMYEGWHDQLMNGLMWDHAMVIDPWMDSDIKNYMLRERHEKFGLDLPALNMQRGREHGLPAYHVYLEFCFGFKAYSWADLAKFIPYYQVEVLKSLYGDWRNVDLWVAGTSERKFPDADVGPTFACILGIQYYHLKFGDRYFVTHGGQTGSFSPAQLENIKATALLSSVICKTGDYETYIQKHAFFPVSSYNPKISCNTLPEINYNLYKEIY